MKIIILNVIEKILFLIAGLLLGYALFWPPHDEHGYYGGIVGAYCHLPGKHKVGCEESLIAPVPQGKRSKGTEE